VVLTAHASEAWAQREQTRDGFWIGFALGYGSLDADCDGCGGGGREGGATGLVKLGGTYSKNVLLGAEFNVWVESEEGVDLGIGNGSFAVYWYPRATGGFFLKGGAGVALFSSEIEGEQLEGVGAGFFAGLGYDLRVGRMISLTPSATFYMGWPGDLEFRGRTVSTGWKHNVFDVTLGLTFH
jgi:hypothetical protein